LKRRGRRRRTEFSLEFSESRVFHFINISGTGNKLELPSLKSLELHWHGTTDIFSHYSSSDVPRLFQLLDLKNVKIFNFRLSPHCEEDHDEERDYEMPLFLQDHLHYFLSPQKGYFPHLESFHLTLYSGVLKEVHLPLSYIKNIKHLYLSFNIGLSLHEHPKFTGAGDGAPGSFAHLQTLTLRNCDRFTFKTMQAIVQAIKGGGIWDSFQWLLVDKCRYLSWSSLQSIVGQGKLEVYPDTRRFVTLHK